MTIFVPADALPRHRRPSRSSILEYDEEEEMEHRAQNGEEEERQQLQQRTSDAQQALPSRSRTPSFLSREISPLPSIGTSEGVVSTTRRQQPTTSAIPVAAANELSSMHAMIDRLQRPTASFLLPTTSTTVALLPANSSNSSKRLEPSGRALSHPPARSSRSGPSRTNLSACGGGQKAPRERYSSLIGGLSKH